MDSLTGSEFNQQNKNKSWIVIFLNNQPYSFDMIEGLNTYYGKLNNTGGLGFFEYSPKICEIFFNYNHDYLMAQVDIPDESIIYPEENGLYRIDKLILGTMVPVLQHPLYLFSNDDLKN